MWPGIKHSQIHTPMGTIRNFTHLNINKMCTFLFISLEHNCSWYGQRTQSPWCTSETSRLLDSLLQLWSIRSLKQANQDITIIILSRQRENSWLAMVAVGFSLEVHLSISPELKVPWGRTRNGKGTWWKDRITHF